MRALLLSFFLIFIFSNLFSQDLDELCSLPGYSMVLDLSFDTGEPISASSFYIKDTIYQNEKYLFYKSDFFGDFYLRIEDEKIYIKEDGLDKSERFAFDFGLEVSDQFLFVDKNGQNILLEAVDVYNVYMTDGFIRKAIDIERVQSGSHWATWISGIGYDRFGYFVPDVFQNIEMKCISSESGLIYLQEDFTEEECSRRSCLRLLPNFQISENSLKEHVIIEPSNLRYDSMSLTFGDGVFFDEFVYEYDYAEAGCYLIELRYFDNCGNVFTYSAYYNYCANDLYVQEIEEKINDFAFTNKNDGIAVFDRKPYYTSDGGTSWNLASYPESEYDPSYIYPNLKGDKGLLCTAGNNTDYPHVLYTIDKGLSWRGIKNDGLYYKTAIASNGYLFVALNNVMRSKNEGESWEKLDFIGSNLNKFISISKEDILYVISYSSESKVLKSTDYGDTWTRILELPERINSVYFIDKDIGFASTNNEILKTEDGGESWFSVLTLSSGNGFGKFSFFDDVNGVTKFGNKLYRTADSGNSWFVELCDNVALVKNYEQVGIDDIYLITWSDYFYKRYDDPDLECVDSQTSVNEEKDEALIYPNPASNFIFIKQPHSEGSRYLLSDVLGNIVMEDNVIANNQIDISSLASGLYFISIMSNGRYLSNYPVVVIR